MKCTQVPIAIIVDIATIFDIVTLLWKRNWTSIEDSTLRSAIFMPKEGKFL